MIISLEYLKFPDYLEVNLNGNWTESSAQKALDSIKVEVDKLGLKKIIMDCRELSYPDVEITRFYTGLKIAEIFSYHYKIAAYAQAEKINRFTENTARNRFANLRVFDNEDEALSWLLT